MPLELSLAGDHVCCAIDVLGKFITLVMTEHILRAKPVY